MKSIKIFATVGAIALLGTAGFTSCNQNNTPVGPGNYNGEVVKTEFSIAFPEAVGANGNVRRMMGDEVQAGGTVASFRGMDNMVLIPFSVDSALSTSPRYGNNITLPGTPANVLAADDITDKGAKVYSNVTIPIGTRGFLFYAKAIDNEAGTDITTDADKHKYGILAPQNLTAADPSTMGFNLVQININTEPDKGKAIVKYLNQIVSATDGTTPWNDCASSYSALNGFYSTFTKLTAGSSASVQRTVGDLAVLLRNYKRAGTPDGLAIVEALLDSIELGATLATDDTSSVTLVSGLSGYPADINLPDGAAGLTFNTSTKKFELANTTNANGMTINDDAAHHGLCNYVYPASLYYFANSAIKVSKTSKASLYDDGNYWKTILAAYTDGNEVALTTRSVAIEDSIQYAVGRLDLKVKIVGNNGDQLTDNDPNVSGGRVLDLGDLGKSSIPVTAVLIGGQKDVDYHFIPQTGTVPVWTIYDNKVPSGFDAPISGWSAATNYTLALETAKNAKIKVAIELENNLGDFIGQGHQLIPNGSKFYLIGLLDPTIASDTEKTKTDSRVFKQDFNTVVNLTIPWDGLKRAYNTIPDLRDSQLELGLSVDLEWQSGMIFDVTL